MESITKHVQEAYRELASLEPFTPSASPARSQRFRKMLWAVHQHSGQMLGLAVSLGIALEDENGDGVEELHGGQGEWDDFEQEATDEEEEDQEPQGDGESQNNTDDDDEFPDVGYDLGQEDLETYAIRRAKEVYDSVEKFRDMVLHGYKGKVQDKEFEALRRLVSGYLPTTDLRVQQMFASEIASSGQFAKRCARLRKIDEKEDDPHNNQMLERDLLLINQTNDNKVQAWVHNVLQAIQAIEFIKEWEPLAPKTKQEYRKDLAQRLDRQAFDRIEELLITARLKEKKKTVLIKKSTCCHKSIITTRKRVCDFSEDEDDPAEDNGRERVGKMRYADNRNFLLQVVEQLGTPTVAAYVSRYLDDDPVCGFSP
ncbi:hypothetical protein K435DRAFT_812147 [Dendrothele bispora CBS 962.96]|uniref:Uncharacterized protein n=1 Tax=Dendrothele bispora (strain CBS 962.96) TaxID=1314807 RepID=A0A4S8KR05_DENBC|nr:hypothetical protein K435DRAFT_812147 [Dendrothele bispora CBS 962.96]